MHGAAAKRVLGSVVRLESSSGESLGQWSRRVEVCLGWDLRLVVFLVACLWRSGPWSDPFIGARSRWGVRAWHQGRGLEAPLCQLCRANLRIQVKSAGESSPAPWKARVSRGYPGCRGNRRRDSSIEGPRGCR